MNTTLRDLELDIVLKDAEADRQRQQAAADFIAEHDLSNYGSPLKVTKAPRSTPPATPLRVRLDALVSVDQATKLLKLLYDLQIQPPPTYIPDEFQK